MTLDRLPASGTPRPAAALRRRLLLAGLLLPLTQALPAGASDGRPSGPVSEYLPLARLQGSGRLTFFGLHVYDAHLWVGDGFRADDYARQLLALELVYARSLQGRLIAERSVREMRNLGEFDDRQARSWQDELARIFPDVGPGDRLVGIQRPGEAVHFYFNGRPIGKVRDPAFARLFFGIWLSPRTSEPSLRSSLLGSARQATGSTPT